jgi:hypothetical protein
MRETTSAVIGFLVAPLIAGVMYAVFSCAVDGLAAHDLGYFEAMLLIGVMFSGLVTIALGVPAFLVLRRLKLVRWWSAVAGGFAIGAFIGVSLQWPNLGALPFNDWIGWAVRNFLALGSIGALSAFVFWLIWKRGLAGVVGQADGAGGHRRSHA